MNPLSMAKPELLGIDIGSTAIKVLALGKAQESLRVEHYACVSLPPGAIHHKSLIDIELVAAAIAQAWKQSGARTKQAAVAVPASAAISKIISLPADLAADELEAHIELEAERYLPYPLNEIRYDFESIGKSGATQDIRLVAARIEPVEDRMAAVELAGLKTAVVDVETYAVENTVELLLRQRAQTASYTTVAVADMGASALVFQVIVSGKTVYSREEPFGIAPNEPQAAAAFTWLTQQIRRSLQFFQTSGHAHHIELLILNGGRACKGLDQRIANELELASLLSNPFKAMALDGRIDRNELHDMASSLTTACGLALRAIA
ncbi:type IV pilus assembly protein PilM [Candidatus Methylospira mobilis]|uniref:Type IV pilus assembly protein PilM n=1 Tax=Candidatus Methylospira mobilis TaxID=1808979 RepID=A0A5Q0BK18_9GAMM|nr:type IV pilus assembly protein PilM [Candidatus Methylospira mobilis]QFY42541.1 type IV pilus assembly protein PilM [Candidatus Methylospira mobilis]WNV04349.1 type IV pilus assembly protein PilM [Candidatus Methylospira mobilis]